MAASLFRLDSVINALLAARILIQSVGHSVALPQMRLRKPEMVRPFRLWGSPLSAIVPLAGYSDVFLSLGIVDPIGRGHTTRRCRRLPWAGEATARAALRPQRYESMRTG